MGLQVGTADGMADEVAEMPAVQERIGGRQLGFADILRRAFAHLDRSRPVWWPNQARGTMGIGTLSASDVSVEPRDATRTNEDPEDPQ